MSCQLEGYAAATPGFTDGENTEDYWRIYKAMNLRNPLKIAEKDVNTVGITEHIIDTESRYRLLINYEPFPQTVKVTLSDKAYNPKWIKSVDENAVIKNYTDGVVEVELPANTGAAIKIEK